MQGFNRYIPPDYDPKRNSTLNSYQGKKHALGARAKDIDKGILVVRFELPFNIWCGGCNAHIGAGVRYNARKSKVGNYYSTPIYGFRCKCHLCDHWFELRTDPKNAAYVVHEGARKKDEDWDPEENGGFAVHDTEAPSASLPPADPFSAIEKTIDQQQWAARGTSRLTELTRASERIGGDPYVVSSALRRRFREEKKVLLDKQGRDEGLKERYGLSEGVLLDDEDTERDKGRDMWIAMRENRGLPVSVSVEPEGEGSSTSKSSGTANGQSSFSASLPTPMGKGKGKGTASPSLAQVLRKSTAKKYDPFDIQGNSSFSSTPTSVKTGLEGVRVRGKLKVGVGIKASHEPNKNNAEKGKAGVNAGIAVEAGAGAGNGVSVPGRLGVGVGPGSVLLAGYESD